VERRKGKVDKRRTNEWGLDREWRGGRERVDKRGKSERGRIYREWRGGRERVDMATKRRASKERSGGKEGKESIREGKLKRMGSKVEGQGRCMIYCIIRETKKKVICLI
jgi:hypothetical protein